MQDASSPVPAANTIRIAINPACDNAEARIFAATWQALAAASPAVTCQHAAQLRQVDGTVVVGHSSDPLFASFCRNSAQRSIVSLSDLHYADRIQALAAVHDGFIVPTAQHRAVLALLVNRPVVLMHEEHDPLFVATTADSAPAMDRSLCWFGYAESFNKSMSHLLGAIRDAISSGQLTSFTVWTRNTQQLNWDVSFTWGQFDAASIRSSLARSCYCLLSHAPLDLQLNTWIKSPNKLISALNAGLIPLCSSTPAYAALMEELGLGKFLYETPAGLAALFDQLDPAADRLLLENAQLRLQQVRAGLLEDNIRHLPLLASVDKRAARLIPQQELDRIEQNPGIRRAMQILARTVRLKLRR